MVLKKYFCWEDIKWPVLKALSKPQQDILFLIYLFVFKKCSNIYFPHPYQNFLFQILEVVLCTSYFDLINILSTPSEFYILKIPIELHFLFSFSLTNILFFLIFSSYSSWRDSFLLWNIFHVSSFWEISPVQPSK